MTWKSLVIAKIIIYRELTVVIALTIAMKTLAMAEMMELRPRPIAEKIEP